jgi:hypothetical protein
MSPAASALAWAARNIRSKVPSLAHGRTTPQTRHPARGSRSTVLLQLATELPAAVLARTLGIDITVAVKWQRAAAGDWAAYAAEISQRATRHLQGEDVHAPR